MTTTKRPSPAQLKVIREMARTGLVIAVADGAKSVTAVAARLCWPGSTHYCHGNHFAAGRVYAMRKKGWLTRIKRDEKESLYTLTDEGRTWAEGEEGK